MIRSVAVVAAASAAGLLFAAFGLAAAWPADRAAIEAEVPAPRASRCPACGWIESRREIPGVDAVLVYEYVLRMTDGSSRVFQEALPPKRLRERLVHIDGTAS